MSTPSTSYSPEKSDDEFIEGALEVQIMALNRAIEYFGLKINPEEITDMMAKFFRVFLKKLSC